MAGSPGAGKTEVSRERKRTEGTFFARNFSGSPMLQRPRSAHSGAHLSTRSK
ncbi:hypothetical protein HX890_10315 [Pseudomonas gingeri]|uniref:hypothetical protein n=1 Tax=Pseudomonas gingeri TaxID=117681 RepID=UPI0015A41E61|nr:hypothetical protein [Pseudomonas gingeri]